MRSRQALVAVVAALAGIAGLSGCGGRADAATKVTTLTGLFRITPGACPTPNQPPTGSYLVVISAATGKEVPNPKGGCANPAYTLLKPGRDGGFRTGAFQDDPAPLFDAHRNSRADGIIVPTAFDGFRFGFATSRYDEQDSPSGQPAYLPPTATVRNAALDVDLRSLVISYAGAPSSTCRQSYGLGCWELGSRSASGSYNASTHAYSLSWFTGESFTPKGDSIEVHLTGSYAPAP